MSGAEAPSATASAVVASLAASGALSVANPAGAEFGATDLDGDNFVTREELAIALSCIEGIQRELIPDIVEVIFRRGDQNGDGKLNLAEWLHVTGESSATRAATARRCCCGFCTQPSCDDSCCAPRCNACTAFFAWLFCCGESRPAASTASSAATPTRT